ncbi:MAG: transcriptional repressor LexA [Planctomycetales bacterium]
MAPKQNGKPVLTRRQKEIYEFLKDKILNRGYGPTVREIGTKFGIVSPNGVMCHLKALEKKGLITREAHMSRAIQLTQSVRQQLTLPMAGQIAAGKPLLAEEQKEKVDFRGLFDNDEHFCLKVKGTALADEQFADGDYVVLRRQETCRSGDIALAAVEGGEPTLQRFHREKDRVRLEPIAGKAKPVYAKDVDVLGVVVGMVRQF